MMEYSFCHPDYSSKWSYRSSAGKLHGSLVLKCLSGILKWKTTLLPKLCHVQHFLPNLKLFTALLWMDQLISAWLRFPLTPASLALWFGVVWDHWGKNLPKWCGDENSQKSWECPHFLQHHLSLEFPAPLAQLLTSSLPGCPVSTPILVQSLVPTFLTSDG